MRKALRSRETRETRVRVAVSLDKPCESNVRTGLHMFDHLLHQLAFYARIGLEVDATSLDGIAHHLVEDVAIVLGRALDDALGARSSIVRYATETIPMGDALVRCSIDLGGRSYARIDLALTRTSIEDLATDLIPHFFTTAAVNARLTLHVDRLAGSDEHHIAEAAFKALGTAVRCASALDACGPAVASTKGVFA